MSDQESAGDPPAVDEPKLPQDLRAWVTEHPDESGYTLRLSRPVMHGEKQLHSISGRRPRARHMRDKRLDAMTSGDWLEVFARSTGTPAVVIDELDAADVVRVIGLIGFFLTDGLPTGPI